MKTAIVMEGGALSTIYSAGVCDALLDAKLMPGMIAPCEARTVCIPKPAAALADLEGAQGDLLRKNEEKIRLQGDLKLAKEQLDTVSGGVGELAEEKQTLQKRIDTITENAANAVVRVKELNELIAKNESELEKLTGDRENIVAMREELSEKASQLSLKIMSLNKDIETNTDTLVHLNARKQGHTGKAEVLDSEIARINEKNE